MQHCHAAAASSLCSWYLWTELIQAPSLCFLLQRLQEVASLSSSNSRDAGTYGSSTGTTGSGSSSSPLSHLLGSISRKSRHLLQPISPNAVNIRPGQLTSSSTTAWQTVALDPSVTGASIPSSFLGMSHEWTNIEELNHGGSYLQLLKDLTAYGSGPLVVRVGGGSTDRLTTVPPQSTWVALKELHDATGALQGKTACAGSLKVCMTCMLLCCRMASHVRKHTTACAGPTCALLQHTPAAVLAPLLY